MILVRCRTHYSWVHHIYNSVQMHVGMAYTLRFSYMFSSSKYRSSKISYPTSLSSATCWAQVQVDLTRCHTQHHWIRLYVGSKNIWIWRDIKLNVLRFSYALSPSTYRSDKLLDPSPLSLELFQVQIHMKLIIFLGLILDHNDLFVYFYVFWHKMLKVKNNLLPTSLSV
jgi:hypothetical protein